jgi:hypothetical protein
MAPFSGTLMNLVLCSANQRLINFGFFPEHIVNGCVLFIVIQNVKAMTALIRQQMQFFRFSSRRIVRHSIDKWQSSISIVSV